MAQGSIFSMKVLGIVLVVLGFGLAFWGYDLSGSFGSQVTQAFTGSDSEEVRNFYIGAAVSIIMGLLLIIKK